MTDLTIYNRRRIYKSKLGLDPCPDLDFLVYQAKEYNFKHLEEECFEQTYYTPGLVYAHLILTNRKGGFCMKESGDSGITREAIVIVEVRVNRT